MELVMKGDLVQLRPVLTKDTKLKMFQANARNK